MQIEVPHEKLLETADGLEAAAYKLQTWILSNAHRLYVVAPGDDQVSKNMADWFNDSAFGDLGAIPAAREAVKNLRAAAQQMRNSASDYGDTEGDTASALRSTRE